VYRADDLTLDQPVALKFLPEGVAATDTRVAQFHNELRVARQVSHKNVCRLYDLGEADGHRFLTMEYVDGKIYPRRCGGLDGCDVQTHPNLRVGQTRPLNERRDVRRIIPSPNGRQFLMLSPRAMEGPIELHIILNWLEELKQRVAVK
jgi:hypothetical protein